MNKFILIATLAVLILNGCSNITEDHQHDHDQIPEIEPISYTMYTEKLEIFVEFKPLVVGSTSKFAAHFTVLGQHFLPLTEGTVTISLIVDGKNINQSAAKPSVPGIYSLALIPKTKGTGKLVFDIVTKSFTDQLVIENVKVYGDEKAMIADQSADGANSDISYLKEQAWKVEFANAPVTKQPFSNIIKTNGQILSAPGDEMMVSAKASGIVLFSGSKTIIGSEVIAGTNLFTITGADIAEGNIDAKYKDAKANFEKAKLDYDRAAELLKDQIVSQKDFQQTKLVFDNAQTAYNAIAKNHSAKGQAVLANISGYVKNIFVTEGQFVEAGTPLATISKNKKLILQANVSQKYFNNLSTITSANFKTTESETVYSTAQLNGKIISYGRSATAHSPFIPVTFEIDNTRNLIPGSVAEVYLKSIPIPSALVIPVTSLLEEQGNFFVYVQTGGESFQKREVVIGASDGIMVQLLSGVAEAERVVTKGAYQIKLATATGTLPAHGHEH